MRPTSVVYTAMALIGLAVAIVVSVSVYRAGSTEVPLWTASVSPGPLSATHGFLGARCESCHTPTQGVEAASCLTCHATAAPELVTKPSTAFHMNIGECAGCHVEHQGRDRRPINMDHAVLATVGYARAATGQAHGLQVAVEAGNRHALAWLRARLAGSGADLVGGPLLPPPLSSETRATLDCAGCHANRDRHRTLFGRDCQACHNVDAWTIASFRHPSPRSQDCVQCHQAPPSHYMMHFEMMDRMIAGQANARVEQCFLCHQTDSFNNIKGVGWFKMH